MGNQIKYEDLVRMAEKLPPTYERYKESHLYLWCGKFLREDEKHRFGGLVFCKKHHEKTKQRWEELKARNFKKEEQWTQIIH